MSDDTENLQKDVETLLEGDEPSEDAASGESADDESTGNAGEQSGGDAEAGSMGNAPSGEPDSDADEQDPNLQQILKMNVPIIVKVAERKMTLGAVLKLTMGSIINFEKDAYQHVDLMINNSTIGVGQPVKIGENFGLRVAHIGDVTDTIRSLGGEGTTED